MVKLSCLFHLLKLTSSFYLHGPHQHQWKFKSQKLAQHQFQNISHVFRLFRVSKKCFQVFWANVWSGYGQLLLYELKKLWNVTLESQFMDSVLHVLPAIDLSSDRISEGFQDIGHDIPVLILISPTKILILFLLNKSLFTFIILGCFDFWTF